MMRLGPILTIAFVLVLLGSNFGQAVLWAVAGVSTVALIVLIFAMRRQGDFRGPGILVDDARDRIDRFTQGRRPPMPLDEHRSNEEEI